VRIPCSTPHGIIESMQRVERIGTSPHLHSQPPRLFSRP
jgi:hypothetical protein